MMDWKEIKKQATKASAEDMVNRLYFKKLLEQEGIKMQSDDWEDLIPTITNLSEER